MLHSEDPALDDDLVHIEVQILHRRGLALEGLAEDGVFLGLCRRSRGSLIPEHRLGHRGDGLLPETGQLVIEGLALQGVSRLNGGLHPSAEALKQIAANLGHLLLDGVPAVGPEPEGQAITLQRPSTAGQGAGRRGILPDQQFIQLRKVQAFQTLRRKKGRHGQAAQQVLPADGLFRRLDLRRRDIVAQRRLNGDAAALPVDGQVLHLGSAKNSAEVIFRKYLTQGHDIFHGFSFVSLL